MGAAAKSNKSWRFEAKPSDISKHLTFQEID
jgi:hypothetical protein